MAMRPAVLVLGLVPLIGGTIAGGAEAGDEGPDAAAARILERVAQTYAGCRTYRDSGVVKTVFIKKGDRRTDERPFRTAFVRPDRFRFQYSERTCCEETGRYIISMKGPEVLTWWQIRPEVQKAESLGRALAAAAGVSGGASRAIPTLLLPGEIAGGRLSDLKDATRLPDADLDKVRCLRVQGRHGQSQVTLWVDGDTHLIRRLDSGHEFPDFRTETTTLFEPALDQEVPEEALEFGAPPARP